MPAPSQLGITVLVLLCGCAPEPESIYRPKHEGGHVRVFNASGESISAILVPNRYGDQIKPGEASFFQKEKPGKRTLRIESPKWALLHQEDVDLPDGETVTFFITGKGKNIKIDRIVREARELDIRQAAVCLTSFAIDSPVHVTLLSDKGRRVDLGQASGSCTSAPKAVDAGTWQVYVGDRPGFKKNLAAGVVFSAIVWHGPDGLSGTILRNTPPLLQAAGREASASAGE